ncbi:hypothetical protein ACFXG4_01570 [Nocardia sp. NPDC059246]|uniref:hypothetical protein n=1 Tax=unclassified Nocardia TaxID=2637762 RepID=UPI0036CDA4A1
MNIGPGSIPGGHRIERALGSGGMGTVHLAAHPALPRRDALWPHLAEDPNSVPASTAKQIATIRTSSPSTARCLRTRDLAESFYAGDDPKLRR